MGASTLSRGCQTPGATSSARMVGSTHGPFTPAISLLNASTLAPLAMTEYGPMAWEMKCGGWLPSPL